MDAPLLRLKQYIVTNDIHNFDVAVASITSDLKISKSSTYYDQVDSNGYTLLHWASHLLRPVFVKKLLELGVSISVQDVYGKTAMHKCLERSQVDPEEVVRAFQDFSTPVVLGVGDRAGRTAFHVACLKGYAASAAILVSQGANVQAADRRGWTGLHFAAFYNREPIVEYLLGQGVNLSVTSQDGWTPLHAAASQGNELIVKLILQKGADPNARALNGQTPLHVACSNNHEAAVRILKENDADPKLTDKAGLTSMAIATKEVRAVIRKTPTMTLTDAAQTGIVGMPHAPAAEREARIAIQARDARRRKRTQGGDTFEVTVELLPSAETGDSLPTSSTTTASPTSSNTPNAAPNKTTDPSTETTPTTAPETNGQDTTSDAASPANPSVEMLKANEVNKSILSGSSGSIEDVSLPNSPVVSPAAKPHNSDAPRNLLRSSQAMSTPAVLSTKIQPSITNSESTTQDGQMPQQNGNSNHMPTKEELDMPPRALSHMANVKTHAELPGSAPPTPLNKAATSAEIPSTSSAAAGSPSTLNQNASLSHNAYVVKDLDSGLYILRWKPATAGVYTISIKLKGTHISGSPFNVTILPPRSRAGSGSGDLKRAFTNSIPSSSGITRTSSGIEEDIASRTVSAPVDLIANLKPDLTPKQAPLVNQSTPNLKKNKKGKAVVISQPATTASVSIFSSSPSANALPSGNSNSLMSSTNNAPLANSSNAIAITSQNGTTQDGRKRSASSAAPQKPDAPPQRDRSGTTIAPRAPEPTSSKPLNSVTVSPNSSSMNLSSGAIEKSPSGNSLQTRQMVRVESTFSPLTPLPQESAKSDDQLKTEVRNLEATVADLNRQLAIYSLRIQELETDHIIVAKKHEEARAEDKTKMVKLATALRSERDTRLCKSCHKQSRNAVAVPCLHMSLCNSCIESLDTCPVCNGHLKGFITALLEESSSLEATTPR